MIYFIRAGDDGHVKIGWTRDENTLAVRHQTLQVGQPARLSVIRTINAQKFTEGWLHEFFAHVRVAGELFTFVDDMLTIDPPLAPLPQDDSLRPIEQRTAAGRYLTPTLMDWIAEDRARKACAKVRNSDRLCTCTAANACRTPES